MSDERVWTIPICPVHGHKLRDGIKCIEVVGRDKEGIAIFCHESQEVEVVPVDSPNLISRDEARRILEQGDLDGEVLDRLSDWARSEP